MKNLIFLVFIASMVVACSKDDDPGNNPGNVDCANGLSVDIDLGGDLNTTLDNITTSFFDTNCDGGTTECAVTLFFRQDDLLFSMYLLKQDLDNMKGTYTTFEGDFFAKSLWMTIEPFNAQNNMVTDEYSYASTSATTGQVAITDFNDCQISGEIQVQNIPGDLKNGTDVFANISGTFKISGD